jgi:hypothetical protein
MEVSLLARHLGPWSCVLGMCASHMVLVAHRASVASPLHVDMESWHLEGMPRAVMMSSSPIGSLSAPHEGVI